MSETAIPRRRWAAAFLWLIAIGLYCSFVFYIGWRPIVETFQRARVAPLLIMTVLTLAALWLRVLKWRLVLGPRSGAVPAFWLSKAGGELSPGRVGELSPLALRQFRTPRLAAWLLLDRVLETVATLAIGLAGITLVRAPNSGAVIIAAAVILLALALALLLLSQRRLFERLADRAPVGSRRSRALRFAAQSGAELARMRRSLPAAILITVITGMIDVWAGVVLYAAFGVTVGFGLMAAVKGVHAITSAIPITPNATGIPFLTAALLLHQIGGVQPEAIAAAIAFAVATTNLIFWLSALAAAPGLRQNQ